MKISSAHQKKLIAIIKLLKEQKKITTTRYFVFCISNSAAYFSYHSKSGLRFVLVYEFLYNIFD